jgi:peroxiredoxin (alkyl hydroperoxide reductase subunit C)
MQAFQQNLHQLEAADTQVLGVSMDSPFANKAWAQQIGVEFPLLSDRNGKVSRLYDAYNPQFEIGRRVTLVISPDDKIEHIQADNAAINPADTVAVCTRKKLNN